MALIKCSGCGKEITDKATSCIHCGKEIVKKEEKKEKVKKDKTTSSKKGLIIGGIVVLLLIVIAVACYFVFFTNNIIGTWEHQISWKINGKTYRESYGAFNFLEDGSFTYIGKNIPEDDTTVKYSGTYDVNGNKIYVTVNSDGETFTWQFSIKNGKLCEINDTMCEKYFVKDSNDMHIVINEKKEVYDGGDNFVVDYFYGEGCSYCEEFMNFINSLDDETRSKITINYYDVWSDSTYDNYAHELADELGVSFEGVPFIVINRKYSFVGFSDEYKAEFLAIINGASI